MLFIVFVGQLYAIVLGADDYCDPRLCANGQTHVACGKKVENGPACPRNAQQITLTPKLQQLLVDEHNKRRNEVAVGLLFGFPTAANMLEMVKIISL